MQTIDFVELAVEQRAHCTHQQERPVVTRLTKIGGKLRIRGEMPIGGRDVAGLHVVEDEPRLDVGVPRHLEQITVRQHAVRSISQLEKPVQRPFRVPHRHCCGRRSAAGQCDRWDEQ